MLKKASLEYLSDKKDSKKWLIIYINDKNHAFTEDLDAISF